MPLTQEENDFLSNLGDTWLGFTTNNMPNYTNWGPGEPNGDGNNVELIAGSRWGKDWNGQWNDGRGNSGITCYLSVGGFAVTKGTLYQTIPILNKQWKISLDIMPTGVVHGWSSILHVGVGGHNEVYGDRTPAIWFKSGTTELYISSAISGTKNYDRSFPAIPMHQWTKVEIYQIKQSSGYQYTIRVAGTIVHQKINTQATVFHNVTVYTGNSYDEPAKAIIDNFSIDAGGM